MTTKSISIFKMFNWPAVVLAGATFLVVFTIGWHGVKAVLSWLSEPEWEPPARPLVLAPPAPYAEEIPPLSDTEDLPEVEPENVPREKANKAKAEVATSDIGEMSYEDKLEMVKAKADLYISKQSKVADKLGWIGPKCDSLFYTALMTASGGAYAKVELGEDKTQPGKWYRDNLHECFSNRVFGKTPSATSTIDEANFLGLLFWAQQKREAKKLENIIVYSELSNWQVGEAIDPETAWVDTKIKTNLQSTVFLVRDTVAGRAAAKDQWQLYDTDSIGTKAFNEGLEIYMRIVANKKATKEEKNWFKFHHNRQPKNPFYAAVYGVLENTRKNQAVDILMDESVFPSDRLPSSANRCADFILNVDSNDPSMKPCSKARRKHTGLDLILVHAILSGKFEGDGKP